MYCPECGTEQDDEAELCPNCGVSLAGKGPGGGATSTATSGSADAGGGLAAKLPGMRPGSTGRNVAIGVVYAFAGLMVLSVLAAVGSGGDLDTASDDNAAPAEDGPSGPEYAVEVESSGEWSGALSITGGGDSTTRSISGTGSEQISIDSDPTIVSVNAQKRDRGTDSITVKIIHEGEVVAESSTSTEFGVAQTSHTF